MEALISSYGNSSDSDSDSDELHPHPAQDEAELMTPLPPPPVSLLTPPNALAGMFDQSTTEQSSRIRSFPHVEGNYALHVYIPVQIMGPQRPQIAPFVRKVASLIPGLFVVDADVPLDPLIKDERKLEQIALGKEFHISLGRTVPIRVHQIDSVVTMLRQRLQSQKRFYIDFSKWAVFVNDDQTRTFLSLEVTGRGLPEITKQIQFVNEAYRLHNLPEFYRDPRPHISLAWATGDISESMKKVVGDEETARSRGTSIRLDKCIVCCKFEGIECKIGKKLYKICNPSS